MYAATIPPDVLAGPEFPATVLTPQGLPRQRQRGCGLEFVVIADEAAFDAHRAAPHFATWLAGVVLPALDSRVRLDLVPLAG
jgi:hypothetical protein